jgi:hypothetical protein
MTDNRLTVVYIMGYGRSGSTLLDILLNNHPEIVSVGALSNFFEWILRKESCACGKPVQSCVFWEPIVKKYDEYMAKSHKKAQLLVEGHRYFSRLANQRLSTQLTADYGQLMTTLYSDIATVSSKNNIVDSSKSAREVCGRAYALARYTSLNVKIIHLTRDGRAVMWSAMKGSGSPERPQSRNKLTRAAKAVYGWIQANHTSEKTRRLLGNKSTLLVRYEDLVTDPESQLSRIGEHIGLPMDGIIQKIKDGANFTVSHNLGGNRLRFTENIVIKPDFGWQSGLTRGYKIVFWMVAQRVARKYNYEFGW